MLILAAERRQLFSDLVEPALAARKLGAKVFSFDFDPNSVACTRELHRRFFPEDPDWTVEDFSNFRQVRAAIGRMIVVPQLKIEKISSFLSVQDSKAQTSRVFSTA